MNNSNGLRFAVIGAGVSGLLAAIKLKEAGYDDVTVYEKASRLGGTWRENTYPGVACDIPSHLYSYSFAPNPDWSYRYAPGAEILAYLEDVARRFEVLKHIRFEDEVISCRFEDGRWQLETSKGHRDTVDVVICATGVTHHPNVPSIPGLDSFEGTAVHSARWPQSISVTEKRVGVVGTGSSAIQLVSALVKSASQVALFQRTAQWIMPQENPAYSAEDKAGFRTHPTVMSSMRAGMQRRFVENFSDAVTDVHSPQLKIIEETCREHLEKEVVDPVLRERLRPNYRAACKRLVVSPDFYRAIQQPNALLITEGIERVEPRGVRTRDGALHELDMLVLATGFRTDRFIRPAVVVGRQGLALDDVWRSRPYAYLCVAVPGFPNFFFLNGPNGPVGNFPLIEVAEVQMHYVLQLVALLRERRCAQVCPTTASMRAFEESRIAQAKNTVWMTGCRSWYLDEEGIPSAWPWSIARFRERMREPALGDFEMIQ